MFFVYNYVKKWLKVNNWLIIANEIWRSELTVIWVQLIHELNGDDFDRMAEFHELIMERFTEGPHFNNKVVFLDEASCSLNGHVNRQNSRYWSDLNPH